MLQPASAQRGVLFDVGVMERVMYGSLAHAAHAAAATLSSRSPSPAPRDAGGGGGEARAGLAHAAVARRQAVRPVSTPLSCAGPSGGDEEGGRAAGGRTTRDWPSRTLEIRTMYEDLAPQVTREAGGGMEGAGPARGGDGMLDLAALRDLGGGVAPRTGRCRSEGRPAGARDVAGKVRHGRVQALSVGEVGECGFALGRFLERLAAVPCA